MSTRRDLLAGLAVAAGSAGLPISREIYYSITNPHVVFEFGAVGPDVENALPLKAASGSISPTVGQTQGPFYAYKSPRRRDIRDSWPGDSTLILGGYVLDTRGKPLPGYILDFWQTDHTAHYDNAGYRYRGHQYTDRQGRFELITVAPRPYTAGGQWRTAHIHAKVQGPATPILTTQLYLPELADLNVVDSIFDPTLLMSDTKSVGSVRQLRFDFVLSDA